MPLPYVVKGMDFSFSGILSACEDLIIAGKENGLIKEEKTENSDELCDRKRK